MVGPRPDPSIFEPGSAARQVLERIADRWTAMVVCALATGPKRYGELRRHIGGITHKMLAQTLRRMEADGLVSRTILPGKLPGVEYRLTPLGETLIEPLALIRAWAEEHFTEIEEARARAND